MLMNYVGFKSARYLSQTFDLFCRNLFAYTVKNGWTAERREKEGAYDTAAHVFRIVWKAKKIELEGARQQNFILRYRTKNCILMWKTYFDESEDSACVILCLMNYDAYFLTEHMEHVNEVLFISCKEKIGKCRIMNGLLLVIS